MDVLKLIRTGLCFLVLLSLTGCQIGYYLHSARGQAELYRKKVPLSKAAEDPAISDSDRQKIKLTMNVLNFIEEKLKLKTKKNYSHYVQLDRDYVTYVVSASPQWQLKHHLWSFPFVGSVPYKGFFKEDLAIEEENELKKQNLDTYRRGVSAYSTLGWFADPLLSSMLKYSEHDLVNTLIHETVHANLYIKSSADFNERLATFIGNKGMEQYYHQYEGYESQTLLKTKEENEDDQIFSKFISSEIKKLEAWYQSKPEQNEEIRRQRLKQIQTLFIQEVRPKLKSKAYHRFPEIELNNARLLIYKTYIEDLSDFERLFKLTDSDWVTFFQYCRSLESSKKPEQDLKELILKLDKKTKSNES